MAFSIMYDTVKSGWLTVYLEGLQFPENPEIDFVSESSADPEKMLPFATFYLVLHFLKYSSRSH